MKKQFFLLMMFTISVLKLFAQPSAAATNPPARNSSDVISLFSGSYTDLTGTDWFPDWGQSTVVTDVTISGNATKRYATLNYQGIDISGSINVSTMQYLHVDIWTANCTAFEVVLINEGSGEQGYTITPTTSGWKSVDIPLTQYNTVSLSNVGQIKLVGTPFGSSDVYLDNLYFWKSANTPSLSNFTIPNKVFGDAAFTLTAPTSNSTGSFTYSSSNTSVATVSGSTVTLTGVGSTTITATQAAAGAYGSGSISATLVVSSPPPATAAPTPPTRNASNVISMFSNAYSNVTVDTWSASWDGADVADVTVAGNDTKLYTNFNFAGIEFTSSMINATNMEKFHIDIWTPDANVFKIKLVDFGPNGVYGGGDDAEHELGYTPAKNSWVSYDINLSDFTGLVTRGNLAQMILVAEGATVYIDNIYFWRSASAPTFGTFTVPAKTIGAAPFTLTAPTSNSTGTFTFTSSNTNVATISGSTVTIVGAGVSVISANQAAAGAYGSGSATATLTVTGPSAPTTGAPTPPSRVATDVLSLFSNSYSNLAGTDWFPWWGQSALAEDTTIAGNLARKYPNLNYHGVQFAGSVDASGMSKLHFDIWTADCQAFDFFMINPNTGTEKKITVTPPFAGWRSYDIALTEFSSQGIDLTNIGQFKFVGTPFGGSNVYLDNIYFWKPAGAPNYGSFTLPTKTVGDAKFKITPPTSSSTVAFTYSSSNTAVATISNDSIIIVGPGASTITASQAAGGGFLAGSISAVLTVNFAPPANAAPIPPARNTADVISLYSNAYTNVPVETWSAVWDQANISDIIIGGNNTKKYTNLVFAGIDFSSPTIDASTMSTFHIDIWTPDATTFKIKMVDFGADGSYGGGDDSESELSYTPTLSGWIRYDIPMANFTGLAARGHLAQMILVASNSIVYFDNVYFWKGTAKSPSISITQPTCAVTTGTVTVVSPSPVPTGMTFSKDNGLTYTNTNGIFTGLAVGTYKIRSKTSLGVVSDSILATILTTTPTAPGTITGKTNISQCDTLQTFSVVPVDGYTYLWSVTGIGNYVKSGQGNTSAVLVMKVGGTVSVKAAKCGTTYGALSSLVVSSAQPAAPVTFVGKSTNVCLYTQSYFAYTNQKDTFRVRRTVGATGYYFEVPAGSTFDRVNDTTIAVVFPDTITVSTASPKFVKVYNLSSCDTSLAKAIALTRTVVAAPASITIQPISTTVCGNKVYRYVAPALPAGAKGYLWSFEGSLYASATIDSGTLTSQRIRIKFTNNAAAAAGDSVKLRYITGCGNSAIRAAKLNNTLLTVPVAPLSITITALGSATCGQPKFRYTAPALTAATATTVAATGYTWSFVGSLASSLVIDSGTVGSRTIVVRFTSTAAATTADSARVLFTSSCGNSLRRAVKMNNTLTSTNVPLAPATVTIALVSDVCGTRVYRYTAPALTAATTTASAATGYLWTMPTGTVGSTGTLDSGSLSGRTIKIRYTSNAASGAGDSIRVRFTSACGNGAIKAQKLSNIAKACRIASPEFAAQKTTAFGLNSEALIYPNPNNGNFNINIETEEKISQPASIMIYDLRGQLVARYNVNSNFGSIRKTISNNTLQNGVYLVKYTIASKTETIRMVVQK